MKLSSHADQTDVYPDAALEHGQHRIDLRQRGVLPTEAVDGVPEYGLDCALLFVVRQVQGGHLQRQRLALLFAEAENDHLHGASIC